MAPKAYFLFSLLLVMLSLDATQSQPIRRSPFAFIQNMTGGHKGLIVPGLTELKQYLQRFGYLDAEPVAVKQADIGNDNNNLSAADHNKNDNYFDDNVESAIKAYQINYNLPVTGNLDPVTVSQMMLPRCGSPDIVNGTRRTSASFPNNQTENHDHDHDHVHDQNQLIHGVSHYSFFPGYPRWNKYQLTYQFRTGPQVPAGTANIRSICARAFQRWVSVSPFTFTEVPENVQSDMHIGFFRGYHGDNSPFDGNGGVLAHAYAPTVGWFHYDADEYWSENPNYYQMDLESVAVHEIGHLLGLDHSNVPAASMYPTFNYGERKRGLNADDIQGIRALYGF